APWNGGSAAAAAVAAGARRAAILRGGADAANRGTGSVHRNRSSCRGGAAASTRRGTARSQLHPWRVSIAGDGRRPGRVEDDVGRRPGRSDGSKSGSRGGGGGGGCSGGSPHRHGSVAVLRIGAPLQDDWKTAGKASGGNGHCR
ncbi:unnamed protein product, partial [Phaeothamnion confervicola]